MEMEVGALTESGCGEGKTQEMESGVVGRRVGSRCGREESGK